MIIIKTQCSCFININGENYYCNNFLLYKPNKLGIFKIFNFNEFVVVYYSGKNIIVNFCNNNFKKVITLKDKYYYGLDIEKGVINLNGL